MALHQNPFIFRGGGKQRRVYISTRVQVEEYVDVFVKVEEGHFPSPISFFSECEPLYASPSPETFYPCKVVPSRYLSLSLSQASSLDALTTHHDERDWLFSSFVTRKPKLNEGEDQFVQRTRNPWSCCNRCKDYSIVYFFSRFPSNAARSVNARMPLYCLSNQKRKFMIMLHYFRYLRG